VFLSHWLKDYYTEKDIKCKKSHVILNGVDRNIYKPRQKFNNGKVNIVTHHWSNNQLKGFDIYEQLDEFVGKNSDKYSFTYIGRDRFTFKNTNVIRPMFGEKLGEELGKYDVYISASRFDPGPNHILESLACKIPTYVHNAGGGCVEFAGKEFSFSTLEQFISKISESSKMNDCSVLRSWEDCVKQYCDLL
jgi:glycosyltransferase involved in cell wall biosynthesis